MRRFGALHDFCDENHDILRERHLNIPQEALDKRIKSRHTTLTRQARLAFREMKENVCHEQESPHTVMQVKKSLGVGIFTLLLILLSNSPARAYTGPLQSKPATSGHINPIIQQDPHWLALKLAHKIRRAGYVPSVTPMSCPTITTSVICGPPISLTLNTSVVQNTEEPDGNSPNELPNHPDITGWYYPQDNNMWRLCGPGASTNVLAYWLPSVNVWGTYTFSDLSVEYHDVGHNYQTTWGNDLNRSFMMHLAWQVKPYGWTSHPGEEDSTAYPSYGVNEYTVRDVLNYEASGEVQDYANYHYTIQWNNTATASMLLTDVEDDLYYSGVPVQAEVDANDLPNWPSGGPTYHQIAIIGYDNSTGMYTYTDTCTQMYHCGSISDPNPRIFTARQSTMWNAIMGVTYNNTNDPAGGDGGWVW